MGKFNQFPKIPVAELRDDFVEDLNIRVGQQGHIRTNLRHEGRIRIATQLKSRLDASGPKFGRNVPAHQSVQEIENFRGNWTIRHSAITSAHDRPAVFGDMNEITKKDKLPYFEFCGIAHTR